MTEAFHEHDRQHVLNEIRVVRLKHQTVVAYMDLIGGLLKDNRMTPWGARAALADLYDGGPDAQE